MRIIGNCYHPNVLKEGKKKQKYITHKTFKKTDVVQQTKHQLRHNISRLVIFLNARNYLGPLDDENKLQVTKSITKTERFEKSLKMYNIINFLNIRYKLIASVKMIYSILNYKLMRPASFLGLHKKTGKNNK